MPNPLAGLILIKTELQQNPPIFNFSLVAAIWHISLNLL
jgi:hypothetical protein